MNLVKAPDAYSADDQRAVRKAITDADGENLKRRRDIDLTGGGRIKLGSNYNFIAHAGGGKASATHITAQVAHIGTVATAADSVLLFPAKRGETCFLTNRGANAMQVFGQGTDTINDVATATGVSQAAASLKVYACPTDGKWYSS